MITSELVRPLGMLALSLVVAPSAQHAVLGQDQGQLVARAQQQGPPVLQLGEIVLDQYRVQNVDPEELYGLANSLAGRQYYVQERGGAAVSSMRLLGDSIVLYDTKEQVHRARELLARLDAPHPEESVPMSAVEYRPRFVSLGTAIKTVDKLVELSIVEERGLIVMHGGAAQIEAAQALLKRIDVPEKQVLLTCLLLEASAAPGTVALPRELSENLQKLLPESAFAQTGMSMLKTSAGGQATISVQINTETQDYALTFQPVSFDEASGALTISGCVLQDAERELFRTNAVLRAGEYTVLAATGATPTLLVVRVTPQG